ncbi:MAG: HPr kinase/phosphorylase [Eubacteriales bacterium SKADARSKE-1]|nr:HPr kinase/phosphorylase [Eubacteriales bacterium SKADARSKE-1]
MKNKFTVSLANIIKELSLQIMFMPDDPNNILISSKDVNRLGLELTGFFEHFDSTRLLIMGNTEFSFLSKFTKEERHTIMKNVFLHNPPAIIVTRNREPYPEIMKTAKKNNVPILRTSEPTSSFIASLVSYMNVQLAQRIVRHGVLMEVYGQGVFIVGDSGVGKSETAIELIKRGHRLVADDAVQIRKVNEHCIIGSSPKNIRHFIELRGIGIINARSIFGMGSVKMTKDIDIVINLEIWDNSKVYDRMGMDNEYTKILDVDIPIVTIPVKPGRNLAVIIEVAAMNNRQKKMGYNAAKELLENLGLDYSGDDTTSSYQTTLEI